MKNPELPAEVYCLKGNLKTVIKRSIKVPFNLSYCFFEKGHEE